MPPPRTLPHPERAAIVGLITASSRRLRGGAVARRAGGPGGRRGRDRRAADVPGAPEARSLHVSRQRQGEHARVGLRRGRRRRGHLRQRAVAGAAAQDREARASGKVLDRTQLILDIFARRARTREGKCRSSSRSCNTCCRGWRAPARRCRGWAAASARGALARRSSKRIGGASAQRIRQISAANRRRAAPAGAAARAAPETVDPDGGAGRLHERRQDHAVQSADARDGGGDRRALRHARPARPPRAPAGPPGAAGVGHGRLHRAPAAHARGGLPRHARGGDRGRLVLHVIDAASAERERTRGRGARGSRRGRRRRRAERLDVYNKCDLLDPSELRRLRQADPAALYVSAKTGDGHGELLETITSRLALDVRRVTLEFDRARSGYARAGRSASTGHARVLRHVTLDGRVSHRCGRPAPCAAAPAGSSAAMRSSDTRLRWCAAVARLPGVTVFAACAARTAPPPPAGGARSFPDFVYPGPHDAADRASDGAAGNCVALAAGGRPADRRARVPRHPRAKAAVRAGGERAGLRPARATAAGRGPGSVRRRLEARAGLRAGARGRAQALLALGRDAEALASLEAAAAAGPVAATCGRESRCCASGAPRTGSLRRAQAAEQGRLDEARDRVRAGDRGVAGERVPLSRARGCRAIAPGSRRRRVEHLQKAVDARPGRPEGAVDARRCCCWPRTTRRRRLRAYAAAQAIDPTPELDREARDGEGPRRARAAARGVSRHRRARRRSRAAMSRRCSAFGWPICWRGAPGRGACS